MKTVYTKKIGFFLILSLGILSSGSLASVGPNWIEQWEIRWTFDKNISLDGSGDTYQYGQFVNGDYWIVGPVTITYINPPCIITSDREINGSMVNPMAGPIQSYDSAADSYNASLNVARVLQQGSPLTITPSESRPIISLVSTISIDVVPTSNSRPRLTSAAVLTIVSTIPDPTAFRPPYSGDTKPEAIHSGDIQWNSLASLPPVPGIPSLADSEADFERPWLQHKGPYPHSVIFPMNNMPEYGREMARESHTAAIQLNLNYSNAQKETLLYRYLQYGIDIYGILLSGGQGIWENNGGTAGGRKLALVFAAKVLDHAEMKNLLLKSGQYLYTAPYGPANAPSDYIHFGEDDQTFYVTQFDVDITHSDSWSPDTRDTEQYPYEVSDIGMPEWGIRHATRPQSNNNWWDTIYRPVAGCTFPSAALVCHIMDAKTIWNHPAFFDYCDRYITVITPFPNDSVWKIGTNGIDLFISLPFVWNMWNSYRADYGPIWPDTGQSTTYSLTIAASNGSVTKSPNQTSYAAGTTVTLTAVPNSGYTFSGWSGDASGSSNPVTITMNSNKSVTAAFTQIPGTTYTLTVSASNGSVTKSPNQTSYAAGTTVTLTAVPNSGYTFSGWSGDASGSSNPVTITMNSNKSVTSNFAQQVTNDNFANAIAITGLSGQTTANNTGATKETGEPSHAGYAGGSSLWWYWTAPASGSVTIDTFGSTFDTLLAAYTGSSVANLTTIASNDDSSSGITQSQITFNAVSGTIYRIAVDGWNLQQGNIVLNWNSASTTTTYTLTVSASNGSVTKSPNQTSYAAGSIVTLTAVPNSGYAFSAWSGDASGSSNPVTITMNSNKSVTAAFTQIPVNNYSLTLSASNGSVTKSPNQTSYAAGTTVTLTAVPNSGYAFSNWAGDASGSNNPLNVTMNANKTISAVFTEAVSTPLITDLLGEAVCSKLENLSFDGIDDFVTLSTDGWNLTGTSIALWFNPSVVTGSHYVLGHTVGTWSNRIQLYIRDGLLGLGLGSTHALNQAIYTCQAGQWYFIVLTWNGSGYQVYVNNQLQAQGTYAGLSQFNTFADIGNCGSPENRTAEPFAGSIDDIRIFDQILSSDQVAMIFDYGRNGCLTSHWRLDDYADATTDDSSENAYTAALINNPSWGQSWADEDFILMNTKNQAMQFPSAALETGAGTITTWISPASESGVQYLFGHVYNGSNRIALLTISGKLAVSLGSQSLIQQDIAFLPYNQMVHLALTWNNGRYTIHVDGEQMASGTYTGLTEMRSTFDIGNYGDPSLRIVGFLGLIDEVRTYSRALAADEIRNLFQTYDVKENRQVAFIVSGVDEQGNPITYSASNLPEGALFNTASQSFSWRPWYRQAGEYNLIFETNGQPSENVTVTVHEVTLQDWYREFLEANGKL